jgi:hypothetical protein
MEFPRELATIDGARELFDWFGYWPSFHDAEIVRLDLRRREPSTLDVATWEMTKETDARGYFVLAKHVVVTFVLDEVANLELSGFSHQNVVFGIDVEIEDGKFRLSISPSYGLAGTITADRLSIQLSPGSPADKSSK